jgi:hypothetical protein
MLMLSASFGMPFATTTAGTCTSQANRLRIGATNGNALDATVDNVKLDAAIMPAP